MLIYIQKRIKTRKMESGRSSNLQLLTTGVDIF